MRSCPRGSRRSVDRGAHRPTELDDVLHDAILGGAECYVRAYLRASTDEQDASRARGQLEAFAAERNLEIVSWYVENESGASLQRPELFRLLADAKCGDILLVEQVDRLSRLTTDDWEVLKAKLAEKRSTHTRRTA